MLFYFSSFWSNSYYNTIRLYIYRWIIDNFCIFIFIYLQQWLVLVTMFTYQTISIKIKVNNLISKGYRVWMILLLFCFPGNCNCISYSLSSNMILMFRKDPLIVRWSISSKILCIKKKDKSLKIWIELCLKSQHFLTYQYRPSAKSITIY